MRLFLLVLFAFGVFSFSFSQEKMTFPKSKSSKSFSRGSDVYSKSCSGQMSPHSILENWNVQLTHIDAFKHATTVPHNEMLILKSKANSVASIEKELRSPAKSKASDSVQEAVLGRNFRGNIRSGSVPMDNTVAVSHNGHIVSAINTNVIFTQPDGIVTYNKGFPEFFTLLGLGTRMYDPRVIYDTEQRRFIFMCLHGSDPQTTHLCLAFSETEDPNGIWNYYALRGNPDGDDNWFDYPNIAVSHHDYYLTGLMRNREGDWQYSVMYQIDKNSGYQGKPLEYKYYNDIKDADGSLSFNLVPTPAGWVNLLSPGMYFVSNNPTGGNTYNLHYTTESTLNNPTLVGIQSIGFETSLAPDARQPNTNKRLNTFDSRIWSAMYLDGVIHMGSHVNTAEGDVGLFYGRMKVEDATVDVNVLQVPNIDFGFPSFAAMGHSPTDSDILVNYIVAGTETFPSQEVRICKGKESEFLWSEPTTVRKGSSSINVLTGDVDRWGDYTTAGRRFVNDRIEAWVTGCFGEGSSYSTWLGQLKSPDQSDDIFIDFVANKTTTPMNSEITFKDLTDASIIKRNWIFDGAIPNVSEDVSPRVTYASNGFYSVTLIVETSQGFDTITKLNYIHIKDNELLPMAAFGQDRDTIYLGESVKFFNLSSINSKRFSWTFINGNPRNTSEREPLVTYNRTGAHTVALSAFNIAGVDGVTVPRAVTVLPRALPTARIFSDRTQINAGDVIQFSDNSLGGITERFWYFEGGSPNTSSESNPIVQYDSNGSFGVKLVVSNELGRDSITLEQYINVGVSSTQNMRTDYGLKTYPNPFSSDRVDVSFFMPQSQFVNFVLYDNHGRQVKILYNDKVKSGNNILRFNVGHLPAGIYIIKVESESEVLDAIKLVKT